MHASRNSERAIGKRMEEEIEYVLRGKTEREEGEEEFREFLGSFHDVRRRKVLHGWPTKHLVVVVVSLNGASEVCRQRILLVARSLLCI